jgi:hypothetical protein
MSDSTLIMTYYSNSTQLWLMELYSERAVPNFKIQKTVIRMIIMGCKSRTPCRNFFKKLEILPLKSQYIFFLFYFW